MSDQSGSSDAVQSRKIIVEDHIKQSNADKEQAVSAQEYKQRGSGQQFSMQVKVYSPFRDYYDGRAFSVSAVNATGPFDVLPKHHNFISLLSPCDLVVRSIEEGNDRRIRISGGIMHVKADKVAVFLDV
jgi:hypothetical protein